VWTRVLGVEKNATNVSAPGKLIDKGNGVDTRSAKYPASLFPSLAVASDGRVAVGWQDDRLDIDPLWTGGMHGEGTAPDDWEVFVATRAPGGKWSAPVDVSRDKFRADRHPSIAFAANGELYAAWDSKELKESGVNLSLRFSRASTGGWTKAAPIALDPNAMSQRPQLTPAGDGVRVVWPDSRSADWRWSIWTALVNASGAANVARVSGAGNATAPAIDGVAVVFTSDRHATRVQRDQTQGVFLLGVS
jgi:hypothetical protein